MRDITDLVLKGTLDSSFAQLAVAPHVQRKRCKVKSFSNVQDLRENYTKFTESRHEHDATFDLDEMAEKNPETLNKILFGDRGSAIGYMQNVDLFGSTNTLVCETINRDFIFVYVNKDNINIPAALVYRYSGLDNSGRSVCEPWASYLTNVSSCAERSRTPIHIWFKGMKTDDGIEPRIQIYAIELPQHSNLKALCAVPTIEQHEFANYFN